MAVFSTEMACLPAANWCEKRVPHSSGGVGYPCCARIDEGEAEFVGQIEKIRRIDCVAGESALFPDLAQELLMAMKTVELLMLKIQSCRWCIETGPEIAGV